MFKKILFAFVLAALFVLPSASLAQWEWVGGYKDALSIFFGPDIPVEFTKDTYSVLQWLIFPFVSLWVILYGIMTQIRIFRRKSWLHAVLAFLIAAIAGPTGGLVYLVRILFVSYGIFGFGAFVILLFVGTGLWFASTLKIRWGLGTKQAMKKFEQEQQLLDQMQKLKDAMMIMPEGAGKREYRERYKELVDELRRTRTET